MWISRCPAQAADLAQIKAALARTLLDPSRPLAEVQQYCEARVSPVPPAKTLAEWEPLATKMRADVLAIFRGEAAKWRDAPARVEWLEAIAGGPGYTIRKLRYQALPDLWIPALLYVPDNLTSRVPVVLNLNGHVGREGKAVGYKQLICINQAKRGMLALNVDWIGMGQLTEPGYAHNRLNQLDLCGASGLAPFYLSMSRAIDLLLEHPHADPKRVAVTGLSGGGWQTIVISALDTRVTLSAPVAGYSSFRTRARHLSDLGDAEQTPSDLATIADYTHLTALLAPRPALLVYNDKDDCCFATAHALAPLMDAAGPIYELYGKRESLRAHTNSDPGTHNYDRDNREAFYRMVADHFYPGHPSFPREEIPSEAEIKSDEALHVELPADNPATFNRLALEIAKSLPRNAALPTDRAAAEQWQADGRKRLREIVRFHDYKITAEQVDQHEKAGLLVRHWLLHFG